MPVAIQCAMPRCDAAELTVSGPASYCVSSCFHRGVIYETLRRDPITTWGFKYFPNWRTYSSRLSVGRFLLIFPPNLKHPCPLWTSVWWCSASSLSGCLTFCLMACGLLRPPLSAAEINHQTRSSPQNTLTHKHTHTHTHTHTHSSQ